MQKAKDEMEEAIEREVQPREEAATDSTKDAIHVLERVIDRKIIDSSKKQPEKMPYAPTAHAGVLAIRGTGARVVTLAELAASLNVHPSTVYRLLKEKKLSGFKTTTGWRLSGDSVEQAKRVLDQRRSARLSGDQG
jgi:excisionase family DNA binding protein